MYDLNQGREAGPISLFSEVTPAEQLHQTLDRLTPRVFVTPALIGINVIVFLVMIVSGVSPMQPTPANLIHWGANFGPSTTTGGQWWRLLTVHLRPYRNPSHPFQHVGFGEGRTIRRTAAWAMPLSSLSIFICGIAASMVSLAWHPNQVSAGASGAIFGLYGALLGFMCLRRGSLPEEVLSGLTSSALVFIGYNLLYGIANSGTDLAAHGGGLAAGFVCGLVMSSPVNDEYGRRRVMRASVLALGGIAVLSLAASMLPRPRDLDAEVRTLAAVEKKAIATYQES